MFYIQKLCPSRDCIMLCLKTAFLQSLIAILTRPDRFNFIFSDYFSCSHALFEIFFFFWHVHALLVAVRNAIISNVFVYIENSKISSILYHSLTGINITEPNELITYKERGNRYSRRRAQYTISKNNRRSDKPLMGMSVWKEMDKTKR